MRWKMRTIIQEYLEKLENFRSQNLDILSYKDNLKNTYSELIKKYLVSPDPKIAAILNSNDDWTVEKLMNLNGQLGFKILSKELQNLSYTIEGVNENDSNYSSLMADFQEIEKEILSSSYFLNADEFRKLIVSEEKPSYHFPYQKISFTGNSSGPVEIIENGDRYFSSERSMAGGGATCKIKTGKQLSLDDNTPISYVVNLPRGEVKGVLVNVYGGFQKKDRHAQVMLSISVNPLDKQLLGNGIAVVKLNLVDVLKSEVFQGDFPEILEKEIHESIHKFYQVLHDDPESLHPHLAQLKNKNIALYGLSYGGRTAVKHAENYPDTYHSYISLNGALSKEILEKGDRISLFSPGKTSRKMASHLDVSPNTEIKKIKDPVLLLHNVDDNNVSLKVTMDFYQKAVQEGKEDLVRLLITDRGSLYSPSDPVIATGHGLPEGDSLDVCANTITEFILNGTDSLPELTDWRAMRYDVVANQSYLFTTAEQKFIAEAEQLRKHNNYTIPSPNELNALYQVCYIITSQTNHLKDMVEKLNDQALLTQESLIKGLERDLYKFTNYIKDKENLSFRNNPKDLITDELLSLYKQDLILGKADYNSFFLANPTLLREGMGADLIDVMDSKTFSDKMKEARKMYYKHVRKEKRAHEKVWHGLTDLLLEQNKEINKLFLEKNYNKLINLISENKLEHNWTDKNGNSLLMRAVMDNQPDFVKYLIMRGANAELKNKEGKDVFDVAQSKEMHDLLINLSLTNLSKNSYGGKIAKLREQLKENQEISKDLYDAVFSSAYVNANELVKFMLKQRLVSPEAQINALKKAISDFKGEGDYKAKQLLKLGVDPLLGGSDSALAHLLQVPYSRYRLPFLQEILTQIQQAGKKIPEDTENSEEYKQVFFNAVSEHRVDLVSMMLNQSNFLVNTLNKESLSPLAEVIKQFQSILDDPSYHSLLPEYLPKYKNIINKLCEFGADLKTGGENSPLNLAKKMKNEKYGDEIYQLIKKHAKPSVRPVFLRGEPKKKNEQEETQSSNRTLNR